MLRYAAKSSGARRAFATLAQQQPQVGEKLHGFTLLRTKHVPELKLTALHLQHDKTGAEHLHIARDDSNNVFSIGFKTNPPDDTGLPHILEHTTLCGSEKYPVRDPFFKMLPRTLSNFMNAFTASDHTFYPFATTNAQDYKNLMSVYIDSTLRPLLREIDFSQEGWRVGVANPQPLAEGAQLTPEDSKLIFKGVVYNEMKGQMSDASYLYYIRFQDEIFPDIHNSGGDPQKITDLTYQDLKAFHAHHYHPSNAKFFTYGDMPLADHLKEIESHLNGWHPQQADMDIRRPVDLSSGPKEVTRFGPVDPLVDANRQFKTSLSWVTGDTADVVESFALALISALLMDGYGSPLYKGLIESGLGIDWSPNTGYDSSGRTGIFSVGLSGVQEAEVSKVHTQIQDILRTVRQNGFERSKIDGYLHQVEISLNHKTAHYGMSLLKRLKPKWFTGADPFDNLSWNDTIATFEAKMAKGDYLGGLMDKYLLNDNVMKFTMAPSQTYGQELLAEEEARLAARIANLTAEAAGESQARAEIEKKELLLLEEQSRESEGEVPLPKVHVKDIPRQIDPVALRDENVGDVSVQWREAPTNGLTYFRAINTLENLPPELRIFIPLFTDAIMRLGTKNMTMEQLEDLIKLKTGGVSIGYHSAALPLDYASATEGFAFDGMALDKNVPYIFDLIRKLVLETNFDSQGAVQQIRQLLQSSADGVVNDIASSGQAYAKRAAEAGLSANAYLKEQVGGLSQVRHVTSLAARPESDQLADVITKLKTIQQYALAGGSLRAAITCGEESVQANTRALSDFTSALPPKSPAFPKITPPQSVGNIKAFYPLPYQVYYGALAVPTTSYTSPDNAPLQILAQLLTHKHLHPEIREKGGAYGGGAYSSALDGVFGFYSYRDPNPQNTLKVMRNAGRWAVDRKWTAGDLEEAKISVFQGVDAPKSINQEGMKRFIYGLTPQMVQRRRDEFLDVTADQVRDVAHRYIVDAVDRGAESVAFLGEKQDWVDASWKVNDMHGNGPP